MSSYQQVETERLHAVSQCEKEKADDAIPFPFAFYASSCGYRSTCLENDCLTMVHVCASMPKGKVMCVEITYKMMRHSFLVVNLQGNMTD